MHRALQGLLPRIFPTWREKVDWLAFAHQGKSDLEKSVPRKLRSWGAPHDRFVIMRDNDGGDCGALKEKLRGLARDKPVEDVLIRIVVQELESWFLGDFDAIGSGYPTFDVEKFRNRAKYRDPERVANASEELGKLIPGYRKTTGAGRIAPHLSPTENRSRSFQAFVSGLRALTNSMARM